MIDSCALFEHCKSRQKAGHGAQEHGKPLKDDLLDAVPREKVRARKYES